MRYFILIKPRKAELLKKTLIRLTQMGMKLFTGESVMKLLDYRDKEVGALAVDNGRVLYITTENLQNFLLFEADDKGLIDAEVFLHLTGGTAREETSKKAKYGDTIRIMSDYSGHGFKIGSVATVLKASSKDDGTVFAFGYCGETRRCGKRHVEPRDYEVVEDDE